jgi:hypothetical protein
MIIKIDFIVRKRNEHAATAGSSRSKAISFYINSDSEYKVELYCHSLSLDRMSSNDTIRRSNRRRKDPIRFDEQELPSPYRRQRSQSQLSRTTRKKTSSTTAKNGVTRNNSKRQYG